MSFQTTSVCQQPQPEIQQSLNRRPCAEYRSATSNAIAPAGAATDSGQATDTTARPGVSLGRQGSGVYTGSGPCLGSAIPKTALPPKKKGVTLDA